MHVLEEVERVLFEQLEFSHRFARLTRRRTARRAELVGEVVSKRKVLDDPNDSPILRAALESRVDYLVTNDKHLLMLKQVEGLRIVSITEYFTLLQNKGLL